jgi:hypothetical protein
MRNTLRRGFVLTAIAGTCVYAMSPGAMAQPTTKTPEAIALDATGILSVPPTADAYLPANTPETAAGITLSPLLTPLFTIGSTSDDALTSSVTLNSATSSVDTLSTSVTDLLDISGGAVGADAITTTCTANADGSVTTSTSVVDLTIFGDSLGTQTFTTEDDLTAAELGTLPAGLSLTVDINKVTSNDPDPGSKTDTGLYISLSDSAIPGFTGETIFIASATCGPYNASGGTPLASGTGLGIGLGLLALVGIGTRVAYSRRRRYALA